jgi:hypothetical protein
MEEKSAQATQLIVEKTAMTGIVFPSILYASVGKLHPVKRFCGRMVNSGYADFQ